MTARRSNYREYTQQYLDTLTETKGSVHCGLVKVLDTIATGALKFSTIGQGNLGVAFAMMGRTAVSDLCRALGSNYDAVAADVRELEEGLEKIEDQDQ